MALYRLVTLEEAKDQLSILDDEDDARVGDLVTDASQMIMKYLKTSPALDGWTDTSGRPLTYTNGDPQRVGAIGTLDTAGNFTLTLDTNGDPIDDGESIIPGPVRRATLLLIARLDDDREGKDDPMSLAVLSLLAMYRDPTIA